MNFIKFLFETAGNNPAASVAIAALLLAVWQGWVSRKHNILSVRPHLVFLTDQKNNGGRKRSAVISVKNTGLGPAIVKDYIVGKRGVHAVLTGQIEPEAWGLLLTELCGLKDVELISTHISSSRMIAPNEEIEILNVNYQAPKNGEFDIHEQTSLAMEYSSLYGDRLYSGYGRMNAKKVFLILKLNNLLKLFSSKSR